MREGSLTIVKRLVLILLLWLVSCPASAARFDHAIWDGLLQQHVYRVDHGKASVVDYLNFSAYRGQLNAYLSQLSQVKKSDFSDWDKSEQLAFLINAYNAFTVDMVLKTHSILPRVRYYKPPNLNQKSRLIAQIKDRQKIIFIPLLGEILSLEQLENDFIRRPGNYDEPRIHFALNRASIDCPALQDRAYSGINLEQQLESATRAFLSDRSRNRFDEVTGKLEVSELFDWYAADFERNWQGWSGLSQFFIQYRDSLADTGYASELLAADNFYIRFLEFNWILNEKLMKP
jgi:hypothetical protein